MGDIVFYRMESVKGELFYVFWQEKSPHWNILFDLSTAPIEGVARNGTIINIDDQRNTNVFERAKIKFRGGHSDNIKAVAPVRPQ